MILDPALLPWADKLVILVLAVLMFMAARGPREKTFPSPSPGPGPAPPPIIPVAPPISTIQPPAVVPPVAPPVIVTPAPAGTDFDHCVALVLKYEGGNDDDPRDPGGRTSRGILQGEWDAWRKTHAGLPSDVWQAPQDQVLAIYRQKYWNALFCDSLPPGVDLVLFDYGVNSGVSRAAKLLQTLVGTNVDGEVGPDTIAAAAKADPVSLVGRFCDSRLSFLQGLSTWPTFGKGWTSRVVDVRKEALAMASVAPQPKAAPVVVAAEGVPPEDAWRQFGIAVAGLAKQADGPVGR